MTRSRDLANLGDNSSALENQGLTLINTTTFSAVASTSINDVFSSTYDNYLLLARLTAATIANDLVLRLRVSGSDDTTANYNANGQRIATSVVRIASYAATSYRIGETGSQKVSCETKIFGPNLAALTQFHTTANNGFTNPFECLLNYGSHNVATSFTGFTIFLDGGGNMTGDVSVYGIKK
jgi:hypothetical protein